MVAPHAPAWFANARTWFEAGAGFVLLHLPPPPPEWNLVAGVGRIWRAVTRRNTQPAPAGVTLALPAIGGHPLNLFAKIVGLVQLAEKNPTLLTETKDDILTLVAAAEGNKTAVAADLKQDIQDAPIPDAWKSLAEADVLVNAAADFLVAGVGDLKSRLLGQPAPAAPASSDPPAPGTEIAHIGEDTGGQVVAG